MNKVSITINLDNDTEALDNIAQCSTRDLKRTMARLERDYPNWSSMVITVVRQQ